MVANWRQWAGANCPNALGLMEDQAVQDGGGGSLGNVGGGGRPAAADTAALLIKLGMSFNFASHI